jgi:hypothetical protein
MRNIAWPLLSTYEQATGETAPWNPHAPGV